ASPRTSQVIRVNPHSTAPPAPHSVVGVVIAGGRSVRFGGEKAVAQLGGQALLLWAAQRLRRSCAAVAVNTRPGTATEALAHAARLPVLHDLPGDATGPLAGVRAGLLWAQSLNARALAVSPCDAPLLPDELFERLIGAAGDGAAMAATPDGRQPLCALWPLKALPTVAAALENGAHPPTWSVLENLGAVQVYFEDANAFANLNTPADLAALAARLPTS
ncbi:MAG TPA: molybdenum cofactor guanylyltransferase, partial [Candidatus Dormibacteraeota bacterium]|nr:molybdenum cofactor guanylyltransferase [Candidatus Dormibacteraeota bacterium]